MSTNSTHNEDQEVDLAQISKKVKGFFQSMNDAFFDCIQFVIRHKIALGILFVLGVGIGIYLDKTQKTYDNLLTVKPNFGSVDNLYSKVELINSKIKEKDTLFLQSIGIKEPSKLSYIDMQPIIDAYQFVNNNSERNFDLLKLIAEDSDMKKVLEEPITSKNYTYHAIYFKTKKRTSRDKTVEPLMKFFNSNAYYQQLQKEYVKNVYNKIKANDVIIAQIDGFLNGFTNSPDAPRSEKLVYYNENSPLKDVIEMKDRIIREQANIKIELISLDKIVKETNVELNIENTEAVNGKLKFVLPLIFIGLFIGFRLFMSFYRKQSLKRTQS